MLEGTVKIIAALINPLGSDPGKESVTLINVSPENIDLSGWALADMQQRKMRLDDIQLRPGEMVKIWVTNQDITLSNRGGIITLLNAEGIKVHEVSYTKEDTQEIGWTILF
ncbi:MAG: lamin tail domain-containing protein [Pleurocapsa sp. MO_226.B13]|nr:lamin tail domain-containing protein [Pleurocapsa sp. MO_226.B13]